MTGATNAGQNGVYVRGNSAFYTNGAGWGIAWDSADGAWMNTNSTHPDFNSGALAIIGSQDNGTAAFPPNAGPGLTYYWSDGYNTLPITSTLGYSNTVPLLTPANAPGAGQTWQVSGAALSGTFSGTFSGDGSGVMNAHADWNVGITNKPLSYVVTPGQRRPFKNYMGYNMFWDFGEEMYGATITNIANNLTDWGLRDAGYKFIGIDAGWEAKPITRDGTTHFLIYDSGKLPEGMAKLAEGIHARGFKLFGYQHMGWLSYGNAPYGNYAAADALAWITWGADGIKLDGYSGYSEWAHTFFDTMNTLSAASNRTPLLTDLQQYDPLSIPYKHTGYDSSYLSIGNDWAENTEVFIRNFYAQGLHHREFTTFAPSQGFIVHSNFCVAATNAANEVKSELTCEAMMSGALQMNLCNPTIGLDHLVRPPAGVLAAITNAAMIAIQQDAAQVTGWPTGPWVQYLGSDYGFPGHSFAEPVPWVKPLGSVDGPEWCFAVINWGMPRTNTYDLRTNISGVFAGPWRAVEVWNNTTQYVSTTITVTNGFCEPKLYRLTPMWMVRTNSL
jgi:hypothetical protein